jgi:hypothetical protein
MGNDGGAQAIFALTGLPLNSAMLRTTCERSLRVDLPHTFTREHVACMENDFAVLSELAAKHPEEIAEIHNAVLKSDFERATAGARKIGLTETALVERGGGQVGLAVGILVVLVAAAFLMSDSAPSTPEPVGPNPGEDGGADGGADAGADG